MLEGIVAIAEVMGCSPSTVGRRYAKSLALRDAITVTVIGGRRYWVADRKRLKAAIEGKK